MEITELRERLKKHDWYYDWSDDMRDYGKGQQDRYEIFEVLIRIPGKDVWQLATEFCPPRIFTTFLTQLQSYAAARVKKKA